MVRISDDMAPQVTLHGPIYPSFGFVWPELEDQSFLVTGLLCLGRTIPFKWPARVVNRIPSVLFMGSNHTRGPINPQFSSPLNQGAEPRAPVCLLIDFVAEVWAADPGQGLQPCHKGFKSSGLVCGQRGLAAGVTCEQSELAARAMACMKQGCTRQAIHKRPTTCALIHQLRSMNRAGLQQADGCERTVIPRSQALSAQPETRKHQSPCPVWQCTQVRPGKQARGFTQPFGQDIGGQGDSDLACLAPFIEQDVHRADVVVSVARLTTPEVGQLPDAQSVECRCALQRVPQRCIGSEAAGMPGQPGGCRGHANFPER